MVFRSSYKTPPMYSLKSIVVLTIIVTILGTIYSITQSQKQLNNVWKTDFLQITICQNYSENDSTLRNIICNVNPTESKTMSMVNRNDPFTDYILSQPDSFVFGENNSLETTVRCIGPLRNQSCLYKNLYYVNSTFMILTIKGKILPILTVRTYSFGTNTVTPTQLEFDSYSKLEIFVRNSVDPMIIPGVTVFFTFPWLGNIGHSLFDALYPAYVALIRFPPRHLRPFRLLCEIDPCNGCTDEDIFARFAGLGIMKYYVLNDISKGNWFVFDELVMGSGMMCQRCTQSNLQLPGGVELDGSKLFRDRMYTQHGIIPPTRRQKHSAEGRNRYDILRAFVIQNKRYTANDWKEINAAIEEINNYTIAHQNKSISDISKLDWPLIHVSSLYYRDSAPRKKSSRFTATPIDARSPTYELKENHFMAQLRVVRTMDIHITGPGTGQMYQTFLPDGSVVINVGGLHQMTPSHPNILYTTYMEQYMTSGAPYLKGLFYPINERPEGLKREKLVELIRQAAKLIMDGFSIPVNPIENLATDGKLFLEMCEKDKIFCELVTSRAANAKFNCYHFWVDKVIHEMQVWKLMDGDRKMKCPFNRTLMRELRHKYGIHHYEIDANGSKIAV